MESDYLVKESIEALKLHLNEYLNTVWKTFAALIVANGWFLSSEVTREIVHENEKIQILFSIITLFMALSHLASLVDLYKKSHRLKNSIKVESNALLESLKETYSIPKKYPIASFCINVLLYSSLIAIIWM